MANTFLTLQTIARQALPRLIENLVMPNLCYRDFSDTFSDLGDTIRVRKPSVLTAEEFDASQGVNYQDMKEGSVDVTLNKIATVDAKASAIETAVNIGDLNRIFTECDYVSLHAPSTPVTKNMINKETLAMMKPTAILINTARGALVVEEDLYEACKNGVITAAGLDAIRQEPVDPKNPLLTLDNVIIYPHIGGNTAEAAHRASYFSAMGIQEVYEGKKPTWPINNIDYTTAKTYDDVKKPNKKPAGMFDF